MYVPVWCITDIRVLLPIAIRVGLIEEVYSIQHCIIVDGVHIPCGDHLQGLPEALEEQVLVARVGWVRHADRFVEERHYCTVKVMCKLVVIDGKRRSFLLT